MLCFPRLLNPAPRSPRYDVSPKRLSNHVKLNSLGAGPTITTTVTSPAPMRTGSFKFDGTVGSASAASDTSVTLTQGGGDTSITTWTWMAYAMTTGAPGIIASLGRCPGGPPVPAGDCANATGFSVFWDSGYEDFSYTNGVMAAWPTYLASTTGSTNGTWCASRRRSPYVLSSAQRQRVAHGRPRTQRTPSSPSLRTTMNNYRIARPARRKLLALVRTPYDATYYVDGVAVYTYTSLNSSQALSLPSKGLYMCALHVATPAHGV